MRRTGIRNGLLVFAVSVFVLAPSAGASPFHSLARALTTYAGRFYLAEVESGARLARRALGREVRSRADYARILSAVEGGALGADEAARAMRELRRLESQARRLGGGSVFEGGARLTLYEEAASAARLRLLERDIGARRLRFFADESAGTAAASRQALRAAGRSASAPAPLIGRGGVRYTPVRVVESVDSWTDAPFLKILYRSDDGRSVWLVKRVRPDRYDVYEFAQAREPVMHFERPNGVTPYSFWWQSDLSGNGVFGLSTQTRLPSGERSVLINASEEFANTVRHFGSRARTFQAYWKPAERSGWQLSDNLERFNYWTAPPRSLPPEEATLRTWSGQRAAELGFTRVSFPPEARKAMRQQAPGNYSHVIVRFSRP